LLGLMVFSGFLAKVAAIVRLANEPTSRWHPGVRMPAAAAVPSDQGFPKFPCRHLNIRRIIYTRM
jgi:hypothetical protein